MDEQEAEEQPTEDHDDEPYDPYLHRVTEKPVSDFGSLSNLVKSAAGIGLFAMPSAFAGVGLLMGIIGTMLMGLLITVSLQLLVRIHHLMCIRLRKAVLVYDRVVVAVLTTSARKPKRFSMRAVTCIVDTTLLLCYIGISSVYVTFIAGIVQRIMDEDKISGQGYYTVLLFPFFFLINRMKELADIVPISVAGNVLIVIALFIGVIYAVKDGIGDAWVMVEPRFNLYPKFFGMVFFSMCSPGLILAIEHSMKTPWNYPKFCGVLNLGMVTLVFVHVFIGIIGYLKWGSRALDNFILNHEEIDAPMNMALAIQALAIYLTYGLQCYMPITILKYGYAVPAVKRGAWRGTPFFWDLIIRFSVTFITCILAMTIPKLDLFASLIGGVCVAMLCTLIPTTMYLLAHYEDFGKYKWRLILSVSLFSLIFIVMMGGVVINSMLIIIDPLRTGTR